MPLTRVQQRHLQKSSPTSEAPAGRFSPKPPKECGSPRASRRSAPESALGDFSPRSKRKGLRENPSSGDETQTEDQHDGESKWDSGSGEEGSRGSRMRQGCRARPIRPASCPSTVSGSDGLNKHYCRVYVGVVFTVVAAFYAFWVSGHLPSLIGWNAAGGGALGAPDAFVQQLQSEFPSQQQALWDTVEAAVEERLSGSGGEPERPVVLLLGSLPDAAPTARCLAERLADSLSDALGVGALGPARIDGADLQGTDADDAKFSLDKQLTTAFGRNRQKAAAILNLDALPPCSILLFHSYCENDNARYKDAAFVFTVTLTAAVAGDGRVRPAVAASLSGNDVASWVSEHLMMTWQGRCAKLTEGKVEAMLSRIANNVELVMREPALPCRTI